MGFMDVTEVLQIADELVFRQTGKHLDDLQETVIKGVWEDKTYDKMAHDCEKSESHLRNIGYKLLHLFSEHLDEDINKKNFRSTLSRLELTSSPIIIQHNNNNFNFCNSYELNNHQEKNINPQIYDLTLAPVVNYFYGKERELKQLSHYIFKQNLKLISVLGLSGIGKTYLVKKFVDLNLDQFELIIWKNLKLTNDLSQIMTDILSKNINDQDSQIYSDHQIDQFLNLLKNKRCLIIFDHVQELFIKEKLAGQFQEQFKNYQDLFNLIKEIDHQSHVILISDEQCQLMLSLDQKLTPVKCLELEGLTNPEFLTNFNLKDEKNLLNLINLYQGNYNYLKDIAYLIKDIFGGKVAEFLAENELILTEDIKASLTELFNKLSPIEKEIVLKLSQYDQPITKQELKQNFNLSLTDLINGLQSLNRRFLIKYQDQEKLLFSLIPVFQKYVKTLVTMY